MLAGAPCSQQECREFYAKAQNGEPMPPDTRQIGEKDKLLRLSKSELTQEELQMLIRLRQLKVLRGIRAMAAFFVVLAVIILIGVLIYIT